MDFTIDTNNYQNFLTNNKYLIIDESFINQHSLDQAGTIFIKDIQDKTVSFFINKVDLKATKIDINKCAFHSFYIQTAIITELIIFDLEISEFKEAKFKSPETIIDCSKIDRLWINDSKFFNTLLVRKNCNITDLSIWNSLIEYSFVFLNSSSSKITFESSNVDEISIDRNDHPVKNATTTVETINVFRTTINKKIKIWEVGFKTIHFHKIRLIKSENLADHDNDIFITTPSAEEGNTVDEIKITDSVMLSKIIISVDKLTKFISTRSAYNGFRINFWEIEQFVTYDCKFSDSVYWGMPNHLKTINKFLLNSCIFDSDFNLSDTWFIKECFIKSCIFKKYPSFFVHNTILEECITHFEFSNLQNFVFQNIDFKHFSFANLDIANAQFRDCNWPEQKRWFITRNIVANEKASETRIDSLIKLKDIYSKLKDNSRKNSDFLNYGKFNISEQEIKRKIHRRSKSWVEYCLLSIHKFISSYGEAFHKPLFLMLILLFLFSFTFLFTGFYSGDHFVGYEFSFDASNIYQTFHSWLLSLVFSLKNIVPFPISQNFFLHSDKTTASTQVLELFHKVINLFLAASFTAALVKYLKK